MNHYPYIIRLPDGYYVRTTHERLDEIEEVTYTHDKRSASRFAPAFYKKVLRYLSRHRKWSMKQLLPFVIKEN